MKKESFDALRRAGANLTRIAAVERRWRAGNVNRYPAGRGENILSYTVHGGKRITDGEDHTVCALTAPAVVMIAKGAPYTSRTVLADGEEWGHTICVRFAMTDEAGEELCFAEDYRFWEDDPSGRFFGLFRAVLDAYLLPESDPFLLKARLYDLLSALCGTRTERLTSPDAALAPAMQYLAKHFAQNTSVTELATMCFLSESYFRARFRELTGMSPTEYRNRLRVEKAEELLGSSLWTVGLVAEALGFCDTSHFYRVYKKITGRTPREAGGGAVER